VGHFVSVFVNSSDPLSTDTDRDPLSKEKEGAETEKWVWQEGQITAYAAESGLHTITTCQRPQKQQVPSKSSAGDSSEEELFVKREFEIDLSSVLHTWVDGAYREEVMRYQKEQGLSAREVLSEQSKHNDFLTYSSKDEGQYIHIDHLISGKQYFAKIQTYESTSRNFKIVFDDKTSRDLKFQDLQKDMTVTVVVKIPEKVLEATHNRSAGSSAKIVRSWYQSLSSAIPTASTASTNPDSTATSAENSIEPVRGAILPDANSGSGACYLKIELIELFFQEGGCESMLLSLSDESASPPPLYTIILHMKLIYYLRNKLTSTIIQDIVLKLKDFIPSCVLRFEEEHIKKLTKQDLNVLIQGLKDIVFLVDPKNTSIKKDMEVLYLSISLKLLKSTQLQKRYLGLSIIKEQVEIVMPEIQTRYIVKKSDHVVQGHAAPHGRKQGSSSLGVKFIEQFILENKVYDAIFGESFHQDLALKSDFLLVFLALRGSLSEVHLQTIWQASCGGHEAVVRVLYQLILHIIPVLHPRQRMSLFAVIARTPTSLFTEQFLRFLKDFTLRAMQAFKNENIDVIEPIEGEKGSAAKKPLLLSAMEHLDSGHVEGAGKKDAPKRSRSTGSESGDEGGEGGETKLSRRLQKKGKRIWLGFAVLWRFVQDSASSEGDSSNDVGQPASYIDEATVEVAVQLLVGLLREEAFQEEREYVLQRCVHNLQLGCSVAASMKLMRYTLALFPALRSGWLSSVKSSVKSTVTMTHMIDKLNRPEYGNLVATIFSEMEHYHQTFKKQVGLAGANEQLINETRIKMNGKRSKTSHLSCLIERLQLLVCILNSTPSVTLSTKQISLLWKVYVEDATTMQIIDTFIEWIGKLLMRESKEFDSNYLAGIVQNSDTATISPSKLHFLVVSQGAENCPDCFDAGLADEGRTGGSSSFADGVLGALFETKIFPLARLHADSPHGKLLHRSHMAAFCMKLFLFVNNGTIRTDGEGAEGWFRTSGRLVGLDVLWKIATDATTRAVHEAASYLIVELHHRINAKPKEVDEIRGNFLKVCFSEMSRAVQCLHSGEGRAEAEAEGSHEQLQEEAGVFDETTLHRRVSRYVNIMSSFIKRFDSVSRPYTDLYIVNSRSGLVSSSPTGVDTFRTSLQFPMFMSETLESVRERIALHFNVSPEEVGLSRVVGVKYGQAKGPGRKSLLYCDTNECSFELMEKDSLTLQALKFKPMEAFIVKRIDNTDKAASSGPNDGHVSGSNHLFGRYKKEDIFEIQDLDSNFLPPLNPFAWLGLQTISSNSPSNLSFINSTRVFREPSPPLSPAITEQNGHIDLFALPRSPLPHHDDMCPVSEGGSGAKSSDGQQPSADSSHKISTVLGQYLHQKPEHFSQLLEMLDGYFSLNVESTGTGTDTNMDSDSREVSAVVWEVIQSLPCYAPLLLKIQKLIPLPTDSKGPFTTGEGGISETAFFADLFDPSSPYSMLYAMQIVDTILSTSAPSREKYQQATPSASSSSTEGMLAMGRNQLEWGWKFIKLGGVEYLVRLLEGLMAKWKAHLTSSVARTGTGAGAAGAEASSSSSSPPIGKGRADVEMMCVVLLLRLVHKFLLFDLMYSKWQLDPVVRAGAFHPGETMSAFVPPGLLVACLDVASFFQDIADTVFQVVSAYNTHSSSSSSSTRSCAPLAPIAELQVSTLESLIDHTIVLLFGLVKTVDNCVDVLHSYPSIHRFVRAITVRPSDSRLRQAGCRGLLQAATFVLVRTSIPHSGGSGSAKPIQVRRSSRHSSHTIQPIKALKRPSQTMDTNARAVITPMNSLDETDNNSSRRSSILSRGSLTSQAGFHGLKRPSQTLDGGVMMSEAENLQRQELFQAIFHLVLHSVHPSFSTPDWDAIKGAEGSIGEPSKSMAFNLIDGSCIILCEYLYVCACLYSVSNTSWSLVQGRRAMPMGKKCTR
jgi:hypothetical protein